MRATVSSKAGWVFRVEIVTDKTGTLTNDMMKELYRVLSTSPLVKQVKISELFESISLFEKKEV